MVRVLSFFISFLAIQGCNATIGLFSNPTNAAAILDRDASSTFREQVLISGVCKVSNEESVRITGDINTIIDLPCSNNQFSHAVGLSGVDGVKKIKIELFSGKVNELTYSKTFTVNKSYCSEEDFDDNGYAGGSGSIASPFTICTAEQWTTFSEDSSNFDKSFELKSNLDLSSISNLVPVGNHANDFSGIFDGKNYTISGFTINSPASDYTGLFSDLSSGEVKNLKLTGFSIVGNNYVGALAGRISNSTISNITVEQGSLGSPGTTGVSHVGGLIGYSSNSQISEIVVTANVLGTGSFTGGVLGTSAGSTLEKIASSGLVTNTSPLACKNTGGLLGRMNNSTLDQSFSESRVSAQSGGVGGLVGWAQNSSLTNSFSKGDVSGIRTTSGCAVSADQVFAGGLLGVAFTSNTSNVYATGNTSTSDGGDLSPLIGLRYSGGNFINSFSTGTIATTVSMREGVICNGSTGASTNNFWDLFTSGLAVAGTCAATGIDTSVNGSENYFFDAANEPLASWDFENIWVEFASDYPSLKWYEDGIASQ